MKEDQGHGLRRTASILCALVLAAACGGSSTDQGGHGAAGSAGSGSGGAGAGASGGVGGSAGTSQGGASGTAAVSGSGGSGAVAGWSACEAPGECQLFSNCCNGFCGEEPITSYTAVRQSEWDTYYQSQCSQFVACPDCVSAPTPHYTAVCRNGSCAAIDVRSDSLGECQTSSDCALRWGAGCCESCASGDEGMLTAVNPSRLVPEVCGTDYGCPACAPPPYPQYAAPLCQDGHCAVGWIN